MHPICQNYSFASCWHGIYQIIKKLLRNLFPCYYYRVTKLVVTELFAVIILYLVLYSVLYRLIGINVKPCTLFTFENQ